MKKVMPAVLIAICLFPALAGRPVAGADDQAADQEAIRQVIQSYLDITEKKDYDAIKKSFHPDAKLMSVGKSGLNQMSLEEWWQRISRIPGNLERKSRISLLEVTGLAAVVRVDYDRSSDYISLLKLDGGWKIVNKTLSTSLAR